MFSNLLHLYSKLLRNASQNIPGTLLNSSVEYMIGLGSVPVSKPRELSSSISECFII